MRGVLQPDHIPVNKYSLLIATLPEMVVTEVSGLEDELETTDLPDRTRATGGNRGPTEFTLMMPMHHEADQLVMEAWYREAQDPVSPTYKKTGTLVMTSISGARVRPWGLTGVFPTKRVLPDLEMANEGEMAVVEWTMSADDVEPT